MTLSLLRYLTRIWKFISFPVLGERCRFYPSCSDYMLGAIENHGFSRGLNLGLKRICRCHPFSEGGLDFVPEKISKK